MLRLIVLLVWSATQTIASSSSTSIISSELADFFKTSLLTQLPDLWQKKPRVWHNIAGCDSTLFSLEDVLDGAKAGLLERRASIANSQTAETEGRWVSEYAPTITDRTQLMTSLDERGTVFFNGAGLDYPQLANLAALSQKTFGFPANINVYLTKAGKTVSVSPHTDAQNVLIFQTEGRKRWKVWKPPMRKVGKDPFGRGKNGDRIDVPKELGEPILDIWLEPGSVLYVPIGFPHATSTKEDEEKVAAECSHSCHITLNLDTYFYGLCYTTLRAIAIARSGSQDTVNPYNVNEQLHERLFASIPFGFLCPLKDEEYGDDFVQLVMEEIKTLHQLMIGDNESSSLGSDESLMECIRFVVQHWKAIMDPSKYENVPAPQADDSLANLQAKFLKDSKNRREEAEQKKLGAFAASKKV